MKVLYIYSGERKNKFQGEIGKDFPDTQFYGLNHLKKFGVEAEYKEFGDLVRSRLLQKIIGFRLKHFLMYIIARKYDVVFGISLIYMLVWKKILRTKTKFVLFNSALNRMLTVHTRGTMVFKMLAWILMEVDGIIFLAHSHLDKVVANMPFLKSRSFFVPMGVDAAYFKPVYEGRERYFLSVGRDNARDYRTIIEVARKMPNEEFRLVCLPRNMVGIVDIPSNVLVYTNIPLVELRDMYERARALLLILHDDSYPEGSDSSGPTVLLEAMAIGLPVIVSRKDYLNDYVEDKKNALLVDFYNTGDIISSIALLANDAYRRTIAFNARTKVDSKFNTKQMAGEIATIFNILYAE